MFKLHNLFKAVLLIVISFSLYSCKSDTIIEPEVPPAGPLAVRTITNLNTTTTTSTNGKYTYFRLSDSTVVTGADTATNKWDIGFQGTTIIINGGTGRFGSGGAIVATSDFNDMATAPESGYAVDNPPTSLAIMTGSGNGWYEYNSTTNSINPLPGKILVIKTGDGKYAKIQIMSYYQNSDPQPPEGPTNFRYYTFKYVYQPDGSRTIK